MKPLLLALCLLPALSFASGTLQLKPSYFMKAEKFGGQMGLSIYEPVVLGIKVNQWFGLGFQPRAFEDGVFYAVSDTTFERWFNRFSLGVGYKFTHASSDSIEPGLISEHALSLRASWKLW